MDTNYKQPLKSFNTYNKNSTTLGELAHRNLCRRAPQPGRPQQGQLIWKGASSFLKFRKNINN